MATQPTNNPVPSESPRDLKFNAGKIDEFVTSLALKYQDRFGTEHYTIEGLRQLAQEAIAAFGWITVDSFQDGATLTLPNQVLRDESTGEYYRWDGAFPKEVPADSTPADTGGVGRGAWISVGDAALRALLASADGASAIGYDEGTLLQFLDRLRSDSGTENLAYRNSKANSISRTVKSKLDETFSIKDTGGDPTGVNASNTALQNAIDALDTGNETITGGKIRLGIGQYKMSDTVVVENTNSSHLTGVSIIGDGKQGSVMDFSSVTGAKDGLQVTGIFNRLADFAVQFAPVNGISLLGGQTGPTVWNHLKVERVRSSRSGRYGFEVERGFMGHFEQAFATHAATGGAGFRFEGLHTSIHLNNCYAASNGGDGYHLNQFTYSVINACATDSNSQYGFRVQKTHSTVFNGTGLLVGCVAIIFP